MKNTKKLGTILLLIGVFILFRKERYFYGIGGRFDNSFDILFSSWIVMVIGLFIINLKNLKLYLAKCNKKTI